MGARCKNKNGSCLIELVILTFGQWSFSGIGSFAHLDYVKCLTNPAEHFDIAIVGAPFDTAVSYRPGKHH